MSTTELRRLDRNVGQSKEKPVRPDHLNGFKAAYHKQRARTKRSNRFETEETLQHVCSQGMIFCGSYLGVSRLQNCWPAKRLCRISASGEPSHAARASEWGATRQVRGSADQSLLAMSVVRICFLTFDTGLTTISDPIFAGQTQPCMDLS
jgi:hypothetical protein